MRRPRTAPSLFRADVYAEQTGHPFDLRPNLDILAGNAANSPAMSKLLVLHGPNLNLLGERETQHYGRETLEAIDHRLRERAAGAGIEVQTMQSNSETALIERVHAAKNDGTAFIIINPAAFTHTSVALRDALAAVRIPFVEVHLSNIHAREPFRRQSYFSDLAQGVISGLGPVVYELALEAALRSLAPAGKA
jgi:3-dehydroquinate dehydratase-2